MVSTKFTSYFKTLLSTFGSAKAENDGLNCKQAADLLRAHGRIKQLEGRVIDLEEGIDLAAEAVAELQASNARMASQLEAHRNTRAMIAALETPHANATARKMARLARGDAA